MITNTRLDSSATEYQCGYKCISWSAIVIGALVSLGLSFLLHLFSTATGLSAFNEATGYTLAIGGVIGTLIGVLVSTFIGGWVSGFLAKPTCYNEYMGVLYGFTTWCLALLLTAWMSFHLSQMLSSHYRSLAHPQIIIENMASPATDTTRSENQADSANKQKNPASQEQSDTSKQTKPSTAAADSAPKLGLALFVVFLIFFLGAISSCFGGYFGLKSRCGEKDRPAV